MKNINELLHILSLEIINTHTFSGNSKTIGSPNVFGGQVLAQALHAAYQTIREERIVHSLHSYFLLPGNLDIPIIYHVSEMRNGGSFSVRRVTASQKNKTIFILAASFHKKEEGYNHQEEINVMIKPPEDLLSWSEIAEEFGNFIPDKMKSFLSLERPIDFKPVIIPNLLEREDLPPVEEVWFKPKGVLKNPNLSVKQQILTYISDYNILNAALNPHKSKASYHNTQMASLDHSMWFFRDFDFDDWMLFSAKSPSASGARGFATANIFTRNGTLVTSLAQEGLMRPKTK